MMQMANINHPMGPEFGYAGHLGQHHPLDYDQI